jgi:hypothetical protein
MMEKKPDTKPDMDLAAYFDAAKDVDYTPSAAFLDAVVADALKQTDARAIPMPSPKAATPWWTALLGNIGGWKSATALTASAFLGVTAGYASPDALDYINSDQTTAEAAADDSFSVAFDIEALFREG